MNATATATITETTTPSPATALPAREVPRQDRLEQRIARLPKATRDMINLMLDDGLPYHVIIDELGENGQGLNPQGLAQWVQSGYEDYLKNCQTIEQAKSKAEFAADLLRELGEVDLRAIHRASLVVASLQMFHAIMEYGDDALRDALKDNPCNYFKVLNSLCNLTNAQLKCEEKA